MLVKVRTFQKAIRIEVTLGKRKDEDPHVSSENFDEMERRVCGRRGKESFLGYLLFKVSEMSLSLSGRVAS